MGVSYERKGKIVTITIDGRTDYNLYAPDTVYLPLYDALVEYEGDEEAWCAILTAVGNKAFSSGGDLKAYEKMQEGYDREVAGMLAHQNQERSLHTLYSGDVQLSKPMIFAVNGICLGAAYNFVMCYADITIAVPHATFGHPAIKWAVGTGGGAKIQRFWPWPIAMELELTGGFVDAETAWKHGFINHIVEPEELMDKARELAEQIIAMPPLHIREVKRLMRADRANSLAASLKTQEIARAGIPYDHPDTREGILAFVEHRKPNWLGDRRRDPSAAGIYADEE